MKQATLTLSEQAWQQVLDMLDEPRETAATMLAGEADTSDGTTLSVNRVIPIPEDSYELRTERELRIASSGWMPALRAGADGNWVAIFFHTHPGASATPSALDLQVDETLAPSFRTRLNTALYASLIVAGDPDTVSFTGRLIRDGEEPMLIRRLRVAGRRLRVHVAQNATDEVTSLEIYDRQMRAFGVEGQRVLADLHVGVVGAGGTGSAVLEEIVRLGVGTLTLIDDDLVTDTNVTRIHGSTLDDVGRAKTEVACERLAEIGLGTKLHPVKGNVARWDYAKQLRRCDLIFGCTDDHAGRAVLSRFAYWYLIPVIDMGVLIAAADNEVRGIFGRVTTATPGEPCLLCRGEFDPVRAREEQYSDTEREALEREGYAQGLQERDPAVVAYTTMVASHAVSDMLARIFGFGEQPVPAKSLLDIGQHRIRRLGGISRDGCYCSTSRKWGRGDTKTPLGVTWAD
jgi:molybdopterin/thiamine biosynthesis adenylyltransferase/proteasome lid subunit RPN8/RPN11